MRKIVMTCSLLLLLLQGSVFAQFPGETPTCSPSPPPTTTVVTPPQVIKYVYNNRTIYVPCPKTHRRPRRVTRLAQRPNWSRTEEKRDKSYHEQETKTLGVLKQQGKKLLDGQQTERKVLRDLRDGVNSIKTEQKRQGEKIARIEKSPGLSPAAIFLIIAALISAMMVIAAVATAVNRSLD